MGKRAATSVKREELNRGAWTDHEDKILRDHITTHGEGKWSTLPNQAGIRIYLSIYLSVFTSSTYNNCLGTHERSQEVWQKL